MVQSVEVLLRRMDTALNPAAIASFLGGVVDPYLRKRMENRFAQEGDDVTGGWAPLKKSTQDIRSELGFGAAHPINKRTGDMEDYITNTPNSLLIHPWGAALTLPGKAPTGETRAKVKRAQQGDHRTVKRPVLGMNERDLVFVLTALATSVKRAGGGF